MNTNKPVVSVVMITYGHEKYIEQAIYGVLMQEADFEIELIIANDCSPDKTDEVIQNILNSNPKAARLIKYYHHKKNLGMIPNFIFALEQAQGRYIALCEGDDYWIDALKLDKQVEFLEENPNFIACSHNRFFLKNKVLSKEYFETHIFTQCLVYKNCLKQGDYYNLIDVFNADSFLNLMLETKGNIKFMDFFGAVYRYTDEGVYSSLTELQKNINGLKSLKKMNSFLKNKIDSKKIMCLRRLNKIQINGTVMLNCRLNKKESTFRNFLFFINNYKLVSLGRYVFDGFQILLKY